jgi:hypothetical protein
MGLFKKMFGSRSEDLLTTGTPGRATIRSFTPTGGRVNASPRVVMELEVSVPGREPYRATLTTAVPQVYLSKLQEGVSVGVRVDPKDPSALAIDWAQA